MAMLQLLIVRNYSRRISCIAYLLDISDTGPDPTQPTKDGEFCDPTRPDPRMDPTHVQLCTIR